MPDKSKRNRRSVPAVYRGHRWRDPIDWPSGSTGSQTRSGHIDNQGQVACRSDIVIRASRTKACSVGWHTLCKGPRAEPIRVLVIRSSG